MIESVVSGHNNLRGGLVSHWTGASLTDQVGSNDGAFEGGGSIVTSKGQIGDCFFLDKDGGNNERINVGNDASLWFPNAFTFSCWFMMLDLAPVTSATLFGNKHRPASNDRQWRVSNIPNASQLKTSFSQSGPALGHTFVDYTPVLNKWFHTVQVYDGSRTGSTDALTNALRIRVWIDGVRAFPGSLVHDQSFEPGEVVPPNLNNSTADAYIGLNSGGTANLGHHGWLENISIWKVPLSDDQCRALWNGGKPLALGRYD